LRNFDAHQGLGLGVGLLGEAPRVIVVLEDLAGLIERGDLLLDQGLLGTGLGVVVTAQHAELAGIK
jgi:hypothetical protein